MNDAAVSDDGDDNVDDIVAWCGFVCEHARRVLASGGPDPSSLDAIRRMLERLESDLESGESARREHAQQLQLLLDRDELHRG